MYLPNEIQFFLGSNTKRGFVSLFDQLRDPRNGYRLYILKGGPGSGKSSLMRRIAKVMEEHGHNVEYIPCASDPKSLDAILDYDAKTALVDGTAPHTLDPNYPGAYDTIINLGDSWDQKALSRNKQKIIELSDKISLYHSLATSCITAAAALQDCNKMISNTYVNQSAVQAFVQKFVQEIKDSPTGQERRRLLSAVSVGKTMFFDDTLILLCPKLYVISDEWGAASDSLLSSLRNLALINKLDFTTCFCSIRIPDKIDHLLFPSARAGVTTANSFHSTSYKSGIDIDGLMNPIDKADLEIMTNHLSDAKHLIETASNHIARAKQLHDELEAFYIEAMDFSKVDNIFDRIVNDILPNK